jgi:hypothetical protein
MGNLSESLMMLALVAGVTTIVFIIARYNYLIKKAMIEKGLTSNQRDVKGKFLDLGCIVVGLGIGFLVSSIYTEMDLKEDTADLLIWGTISIFGGSSLIIAHFIRNRFGK